MTSWELLSLLGNSSFVKVELRFVVLPFPFSVVPIEHSLHPSQPFVEDCTTSWA